MIADLLIKYLFRLDGDYQMFLGKEIQKGSLVAALYLKDIWRKESLKKKILSILRLKWIPTKTILQNTGIEVFRASIFGNKSDYSEEIIKLMIWHNSQKWILNELNDFDKKRADSLSIIAILIRTLNRKSTSDVFRLKLGDYSPDVCFLLLPMVVKIPVISIQYYIEIHSEFAFNSIRKSKHAFAEEIISYLYEIIYIQQKTTLSLHEYVRLTVYAQDNKKTAILINAEMSAIMGAELSFSYLKALIEKTVVLVGLIYKIKDLESKKTHKQKLGALAQGVPEEIKKLFYYQTLIELIKSENLDELNNYRSGILHKKGISDLQVHNYINEKPENIPLRKIYQVLHEQHVKNSVLLICALALLTDELVKLDAPSVSIEDLMGSL